MHWTRKYFTLSFFLFLLALGGCDKSVAIVHQVDEREANEIIVLLSNFGISASKVADSTSTSNTSINLWNIEVNSSKETEAIARLSKEGFPRKTEEGLLQLFADTGLMTSDKQEQIRYHSGLEKELQNMIRKFDGVIDVVVKLSLPTDDSSLLETKTTPLTAAVLIKHEGSIDDPNSHLLTKVKRLVARSVPNLSFENVTVVLDRVRFSDITLPQSIEAVYSLSPSLTQVWGITLLKTDLFFFRTIFVLLLLTSALSLVVVSWIIWKVYPLLPQGGVRKLFNPALVLQPFTLEKEEPKVDQEPTS